MKHIPLLMTASVSTRGMKGACFTDEERETMYVTAIRYYIENLFPKDKTQKIIFAENSGWDLTSIKAQLPAYEDGRIEFISLDPCTFDISKGKGYNELLMINQVAQCSKIINEAGAFFKVTGRYPVYNIKYFLDSASKKIYSEGYDLYCDIKDHKLYDILRTGWNGHSFECRLFGVKTTWYGEHIAPLYLQLNDYEGNLLETVLFKNVKNGGVKSVHVSSVNPTLAA